MSQLRRYISRTVDSTLDVHCAGRRVVEDMENDVAKSKGKCTAETN